MTEYRVFTFSSAKTGRRYVKYPDAEERIDKIACELGVPPKNYRNHLLPHMRIEYDTAAYYDIYKTAEKYGYTARICTYSMEYTKKDLDNSDYFELKLGIYGKEDYTEKYQTKFTYSYCESCDTYQYLPEGEIYINKTEFRGKDIFTSMNGNNEIIVSDKIKTLIEELNLTGVEFYPAYHYNNRLKNDFPVWHMAVTNKLPPMDESVPLRIDDGYCSVCKKHHVLPLSYLRYSTSALDNACDFNISCESFGNGWYGSPRLIISRRVYEMLKNNKIKGCRFEIVGIV